MRWNEHSRLKGEHAFLGASTYSWLNYDDEKLGVRYRTARAAALGTALHDLAAKHIQLKIRMPKNNVTLNRYINDAIGFGMTPEQPLFYSVNAFGTVDAIKFDERKSFLRVHDLKTGVNKASMAQLDIYNALFCLEYDILPTEISSELRIYQNDEIYIREPEPDEIAHVMSKIVHFDKLIEAIKAEEAF